MGLRPLTAALEADAPTLHRPSVATDVDALDPVNTTLAATPGRRLWNRVLRVGIEPPGDRVTLSIRAREAAGRLIAWPADDPWLRLRRTSGGALRLTVDDTSLEAASTQTGWRTLAVVLDGAAGVISLLVDGRVRATRVRAPFGLPDDPSLAIGPAVGDVADLALWPDALPAGRLLDHHLTAEGLRGAPEPPRLALTVRQTSGLARFGCPRFAPDGGWLVGCHSNALIFVDRATGEPTGRHIEHLDPLTAVHVDPTGRAVATADGGREVLVWSVAEQRPRTRIDVGHAAVGVAFAPDGRTLAAWSPPDEPGRVTLAPFDAPDARARTIALPGPIHHAVWRPDGRALAVALTSGPTQQLTLEGRAMPLDGPPATALAWHPTAPRLFAGAADGSVRVYDDGRSRVIRAASTRPEPPAPDRLPAFFAADGEPARSSWFIGARWGTFGRPAWTPPTDRRAVVALAVDAQRVAWADDGGAHLRDHDGGRAVELPHPTPATAVALTGGLLVTGAADGVVRRFAATDGRALATTADDRRDAAGRALPVRAVRISPDGGQLAVDHLGVWQSRLLDLAGGPAPALPAPSTLPSLRMAVSPSGLQVLVARYTGRLVGWDLSRLRRVVGFVSESPATSLLWTADGPVSGHSDGTVRRWDARGRLVATTAAHAPGVTFAGQAMPTGGVDGLFELADGTWVSSGRLALRRWRGGEQLATHTLSTPSLQIARPVMDGEQQIVVSTIAGPVRVDPMSGAMRTLVPPAGGIGGSPFAFLAAGGPYIAGVRHTPSGQRVAIWRVAGGPPLDLALPVFTRSLTLSADGARLAVAGSTRGADGEWQYPILIVDPANGVITARIEGHRAAPSAVVFEPGRADRLHTGAWDGHQRVFALDDDGAQLVERRPGCPAMALAFGPSRVALCTDQLELDRGGGRLTLIDDADGQWLIGTDDGLFAASREGDHLASAIAGPRLLGLDRVALAANRPDLIATRFGLGDPALRADLEARVRRRRARHGLKGDPPPLTALPRVDLGSITLRDGRASLRAGARSPVGLSRWRVRADGTPVAEGPLDGTTGRFTAEIPLVDGSNRIEVDVADGAGRWSPRARATVEHHDPTPPDLFVIAFGVSDYADPAIRDLRFAHRDALDLTARFGAARRPWGRVVTRAFTDEAVVADAFAEAERILGEARPRDTVILFVSGHGLYDRGGVYRYLTHDAVLAEVERSVPFDRIEGLLDATAARRRLLLLDTCQSGELFDDTALVAPAADGAMLARVIPLDGQARIIRPIVAAPAPAPVDDRRDRFVDRDLRRGRGAVVFSSSSGAEASWELEQLANGAFTEALLDGLAGAADPDGDGWITLPDLRDQVARSVAEVTADRQHPTIDRENRAARIRLPVIPAP